MDYWAAHRSQEVGDPFSFFGQAFSKRRKIDFQCDFSPTSEYA